MEKGLDDLLNIINTMALYTVNGFYLTFWLNSEE